MLLSNSNFELDLSTYLRVALAESSAHDGTLFRLDLGSIRKGVTQLWPLRQFPTVGLRKKRLR
jgi:hypothetical protein